MIKLIVIVEHAWDKTFFEAQKIQFRSHDIKILSFGKDSTDALLLYEKLQPDLLIMPFLMPGKSALTVARRIKNHDPNAHLLIIMDKPIRFFSRIIFEEHLGSLISREATVKHLIEAIKKTQMNYSYFFQEYDHYFTDEIGLYRNPVLFNSLSNSEWDVLMQLLQYKKVDMIAKELNVQPETIYTHRRNLFAKLKIHEEKDFLRLIKKYKIVE